MRISDWSSDVCSSDLQQHLHRTGRAVWQRQLVHFTESQLLELGCGFLARRQHTATYLARCSRSLLQNRSTVVNNVIRSRSGRYGGTGMPPVLPHPHYRRLLERQPPIESRRSARRSEERSVGNECVSTC